ncbi:hypothetical protein QC764_511116 [Podospora pseudoanserina]|uniref:Peptidase S8/S53 domain-containing protein n=1 Tax=Podospora pseudoanserina TaxID=2609844 RepID=A0ABR0I7G7_9PEZI|nr:hypothetical protein QC764_511116 [Podospora pseudoanserina]
MALHNDGQIGMERGVLRYEDVNGHTADAEFPFSEVLKHELHYRERIVLCLRLVRSLLDLHNTTWLRGDWGVEDIWVYGKSSSSELQLRQPYLRLALPSNQSDSPVDSQPSTTSDFFGDMHRFPHALSLGVVLMQILLSDRLQIVAPLEDYRNERRRHLSEDIRNDVNLKVVQAERLLKECQKRLSARSPLIKAISGCTKPNLFGPNENGRGADKPLLGDSVGLFENDTKRSYSEFSREPSAMGESSASATQGASVSTLTWNESLVELTEKNIEPLRLTTQSLSRMNGRSEEGGCRPDDMWNNLVSVAILDTGCEFSLDKLKDLIVGDNTGDIPFPKRVGWKDFGDESRRPSDPMVGESESRHGTIMARLFLGAMGMSKVYIPRVMKGTSDDRGAAERLAAAVEWAINECNVDIISISLRLNKPSEEVRKRFHETSGKALIFASGRNMNQGTYQETNRLPGNVREHPHPELRNFQVIGQDFNVPNPADGTPLIFQGTSCATPTAAGMAAFVIDFTRAYGIEWAKRRETGEKDEVDDIRKTLVDEKQRLKCDRIMMKVLLSYITRRDRAHKNLKGKYIRLNPELLFECAEDPGKWQRSVLLRIAEALKDKNGIRTSRRSA